MKEGRVNHLVYVELLIIILILCHLKRLGIKPPDETVKEKSYQHQKYSYNYIGDRGGEIGFYFFLADSPYVFHCSTPPEITLR